MIDKYHLPSGVMEGWGWQPTLTDVPQGGVVSPLWSNIFLTPFDRWMTQEGYRLIRSADDFVIICRTSEEAQRLSQSACAEALQPAGPVD